MAWEPILNAPSISIFEGVISPPGCFQYYKPISNINHQTDVDTYIGRYSPWCDLPVKFSMYINGIDDFRLLQNFFKHMPYIPEHAWSVWLQGIKDDFAEPRDVLMHFAMQDEVDAVQMKLQTPSSFK